MPNRDGSRTAVTEFFGDAEYSFDIVDQEWKLLIELEEKVGNILPFFYRLRAGDFRVTQLRQLIRLGLIGGGQSPKDAARLVETYFDKSPITEYLPVAIGITGGALFGVSDDGTVKDEAADAA